ncbi:hypothetical protein COCNU_14G012500 [Cocos nucifera]|uniref:SGS domain-containing protein n=1 Tax=Cocos nucifera TaxID=13894 RepID=A0A8K0IW47_COCNU|nr:hypothetical protein COCNU_14G012500 [Cocos nucifera]
MQLGSKSGDAISDLCRKLPNKRLHKAQKRKLKPSLDKDKDPMAGILDLMKNMYKEGDDDMKRTTGKAWSDARSRKIADSLKGYP